jgi:FkbM family methyltransferase
MRDLLAHLLLHYSEMARFLRRVPVLGAAAHRIGHRLVPPGTRVWAKVRDGPARGLWLRVDPRYESGYVTAAYEPRVQQFLQNHLRPGMVFYDVGAHIGFFSLLAARLVGSEGRVFSFEAVPENASRLRENARRNELDQITVVPAAVWKECGRLRFQRASNDSSHNTGRVVLSEAPTPELMEVDAIALDSFAQKHPAPQVIKIDVEGSEAQVLHGAVRILTGARPVLVCEIHGPSFAAEFQGWLAAQRYQLEWVEQAGEYPRHLLLIPSR